MEQPLFHGAKLKIKRANQHIRTLVQILQVSSQFSLLGVEDDPETAGEFLMLEMRSERLDEIPLIIGDVIHNLRTALDHMVCELVTHSGGTLTKHTRFTFWETRKKAVAEIEGVIQGVSLDVITSLLEHVQPYRGGNDALCALHALDIADKHRLIVPVCTVSWIAIRPKGREWQDTHVTVAIEQGKKTRLIEVPAGTKIHSYRNLMVHVVFNNVERFEGESVLETLHQLQQIVTAVVQEMERALLGSRTVSS